MKSERVLEIFKEITRVPRESGHEELIIAYLQQFAASHSLECKTDEAGNVLIVKNASEGRENVPTIVLQSHSDMVCEKIQIQTMIFLKILLSMSLKMAGWLPRTLPSEQTVESEWPLSLHCWKAIFPQGE